MHADNPDISIKSMPPLKQAKDFGTKSKQTEIDIDFTKNDEFDFQPDFFEDTNSYEEPSMNIKESPYYSNRIF